jgi:hypothetical protein
MSAQTDHFGEAVVSRLEEMVAAVREPASERTPVELEAARRELTQVIEVRAMLVEAINRWESYLEGRDPTREPFVPKLVERLGKALDGVDAAIEGSSWQKRRKAVKDVLIAWVWDWLEAERNPALGDEVQAVLSRVTGHDVDLAKLDVAARDERDGGSGTHERHADRIVRLVLGH